MTEPEDMLCVPLQDTLPNMIETMISVIGHEPFNFTLYESPADLPGHYVLRGFDIKDGKPEPLRPILAVPIRVKGVSSMLGVLRAALALRGRIAIIRAPDDEPHIVECWL